MRPELLAILGLLALAALASLVRGVLRTLRNARLCELPLQSQQYVDLPIAGRVVLCLQGPRFTPGLGGLRFELRPAGGPELSGHRIWFRTVTSGVSRARVALRTFNLPTAGRYDLAVGGLDPRYERAPEHSIVFMRPHLARTLVLTIGITLTAALAILSLVFFLLSILPAAHAIDPGRASGFLEIAGERIELPQACAHLHSTTELRIVLSDAEVPQATLSGADPLQVLEHARSGKVRGVLLRLDPARPETVTLVLLDDPRRSAAALVPQRHSNERDAVVRGLQLSAQRVGGDLTCPPSAGFRCLVHFSAPLFHD